ncbi:hypothetical protein [Comamonas sp. JC664]|uniref:hypothetical protein n=1 Tax=Comamonas sp. JC664 TaxID=2801917 RepID=UPI00174A8A05|nr:hypothetical protein [Comamonas sp. JC664]MBL0697197.1 hypothetical protein [Comamonas sp. JC664]GHG83060.1 hypothetical protein GCM10012319_37690 [Comamonas sp. KCTC 72670]
MPETKQSGDPSGTGMGGSEAGRTVQPCATPRRARVRIIIRDTSFEVHAGLRYRLEVAGETLRGTLGSDGLLDVLVPESAASARLLLWAPRQGTRAREWALELGTLQPTDALQGARDRLENLGFLEENTAGQEEGALAAYQAAMGLPVSTQLDERTQAHLDETYHDGRHQPSALPWRPGVYREVGPDEDL